MLKPEERRTRERDEAILAALQNLYIELRSLVQLLSPYQETENPISANQSTAEQHGQPRPQATVHAVTQRSNAEISQDETDRQGTNAFQRRTLTVQWCLFTATMLAFGAAAYYAFIAKQQKDTMEGTFQQIRNQTILTRQQVVGTQAAFLRLTYDFDPINKAISISIDNEGLYLQSQHVAAKNTTLRFGVSRRQLPSGKILWESPSITRSIPHIGQQTFREIYQVPMSGQDQRALHDWLQTIRIEGSFSYDNGFGDLIPEEALCQSYLGPFDIEYAPGQHSGNGQGGFARCDAFGLQAERVRLHATHPTK